MGLIKLEFNSKLNAFEVYSLFKNQKDTILLDSSKSDNNLSHYSFIGINPFLQLLLDKNSSQLHTVSPKIQIVIINTFLTLMEIICEALDLWLDKCNSNVILLFSFIHQFTIW